MKVEVLITEEEKAELVALLHSAITIVEAHEARARRGEELAGMCGVMWPVNKK